jgi:cytidine deaminase
MDPLLAAAISAREHAYARYSNFRVGAAIELEDGRIVTGCNVENASYGLTICAERLAIFKAIGDGAKPRTFQRIAVCADTERLTPPCGACRQILWEFCGNIPVILTNLRGVTREFSVSELIPEAFDDSLLG